MKGRYTNIGGRSINSLDPYVACHSCLGCNQLSMRNFHGVYECDHYIKGVYDNEHRKEVRATDKGQCSR